VHLEALAHLVVLELKVNIIMKFFGSKINTNVKGPYGDIGPDGFPGRRGDDGDVGELGEVGEKGIRV
jgi:hypothetical protein